jgi:hypothetical protein
MTTITQHFDNMSAFADFCESNVQRWRSNESTCSSNQTWSGADTLAQAFEFARLGTWQCPDVSRFDGAVMAPSTNDAIKRDVYTEDFVGALANVPAYVAGLPMDMYQIERMPSDRRIVRVLLQRNYSSNVDTDLAIDAGVIILAFLNKLEQETNCTVELDLGCFTKLENKTESVLTISVKRAGEPLDVSELAFGLACPAFCRRLLFRYYETLPANCESRVYGYPQHAPTELAKQYDLYIPRPTSEERTAPVLAAIKKYVSKE